LVNTPKPVARRLSQAIEGRDIVKRAPEKGGKK
jgi:hypothetical protein